MGDEGLSKVELAPIINIERASSILSLIGSLFVIVTFVLSSRFRKPFNRLVFYATFGNVMSNVGSLISRSYLTWPNSIGCQFQAFLIQMFMPADAFWTLAMAINVYLAIYYRFEEQRLRKLEIPYFLCCYGVPLIPAITYIFVKDSSGHRIYGNAVLWCWVTTDWSILRVLTFYAPVWTLILITFFIYIRVGCTFYNSRRRLRAFHTRHTAPTTITTANEDNIDASSETELGIRASHFDADSVDSSSPRTSAAGPGPSSLIRQYASSQISRLTRRRSYPLSSAVWSYTRCSLLFFTALLITWLPSSANRVYSIVHNDTLPSLEYASAFVLPLQGFWNAVIYGVTSWTACKYFWSDLRHGRRSWRHYMMETSSDPVNHGRLSNGRTSYTADAGVGRPRPSFRPKTSYRVTKYSDTRVHGGYDIHWWREGFNP